MLSLSTQQQISLGLSMVLMLCQASIQPRIAMGMAPMLLLLLEVSHGPIAASPTTCPTRLFQAIFLLRAPFATISNSNTCEYSTCSGC
jgi:hypothetical protein